MGDQPALAERLFGTHGARVRAFFRVLTGRAELAEDLAQEVFVRVVRGEAAYEPRGREQAWLFRIARHVAADHWRREQRAPGTGEASEPSQPAVQAVRVSLTEALAALARDEREAFLLCEMGGLSYAEIAAVLETTAPAVRSLLYRARLKLRDRVMAPPPAPRRVRAGDQR